MAKYIKASLHAAQMLNKDRCGRTRTPDGCVLLWQNDMLPLGPLSDLEANAARIGALTLTAEQAREEARGIVSRPLPEPTDPAFADPDTAEAPDMASLPDESDQPNESDESDESDQSDHPGESENSQLLTE